jgi:hypothetical protein
MAQATDVAASAAAPRRAKRLVFDFMRFLSLLVGAGLLLRTGAAEQGGAAQPEHPDDESEHSQTKAQMAQLPGPAFGQRHAGAAVRLTEAAEGSERTPPPIQPAAKAHTGAARGAGMRPALATSLPTRLTEVQPAIKVLVSSVLPTPHKVSSAPLALSGAVSAVPMAAQAVRAPAVVATPRAAMVAVAAPRMSASDPAAAARVVVDPAVRMVVPVPSTRTSDLAQVMRSPASAWDYAGVALPVPVMAQAAVTAPRPVEVAVAQPAPRAVQLELPLARPAPPVAAKPVAVATAPAAAPVRQAPAQPQLQPQVARASEDRAETQPTPAVEVSRADDGARYLPENNVAGRAVSRSALAQLAATAARIKPINAPASVAYAAAVTKRDGGGGNPDRDRLPRPAF